MMLLGTGLYFKKGKDRGRWQRFSSERPLMSGLLLMVAAGGLKCVVQMIL
jgi:hypothetical protein